MPLDEWIDLKSVKAICQHVSTFALGLLASALGKPVIRLAEIIGASVSQPLAPWLREGLSKGDDILIAYFALSLGIRLVVELWPLRKGSHLVVMASLLASGVRYA